MSENDKFQKFNHNTYSAVLAVLLESVREIEQLHCEVLQERFKDKDIPTSARRTAMMPSFAGIFAVLDEFSQFFSVHGEDFDETNFKGFFLSNLLDFVDKDVYKDLPEQAVGLMSLKSTGVKPTHDEHDTVQ